MRTQLTMCSVLAGLLLAALPAQAQYDLSWNTIDGGGWTFSSGGTYTLGGTIGQPDAGPTMSGGTYTMTGGFWPGVPVSPVTVGDMNCDGAVDFKDINPFVKYVTDCAAWQALYPSCSALNGDIDGDGVHSCNGNPFDDINAFVALLSGG